MASVTISLEHDCCPDAGTEFAGLYDQLSGGQYEWPCSVLALPDDFDAYLAAHRTARRRRARCLKRGYRFTAIDRSKYADDIYEINVSAEERQGRPMSEGYRKPVEYGPLPDYACPRHAIRTYGVVDETLSLHAYAWVYRAGQLVMFSSILGHAATLEDDVMYLLVTEALREQLTAGEGFAFYNMHDSGTDGLRFFKERCGFEPTRIVWIELELAL